MAGIKKFYRICNLTDKEGLWYDFKGNFTGNIHTKFSFCSNHDLAMDFDEELIGYLSCTPTLDSLYQWFTQEDILALQKHNYFIHVFEADDYFFYERFQHFVINQQTSKVLEKIVL